MITLDGRSLDAASLTAIARGEEVQLDPGALALVSRNRQVVDRILAEGRVVYGINTGFGQFATVVISPTGRPSCSATSSAATPPASAPRSRSRRRGRSWRRGSTAC